MIIHVAETGKSFELGEFPPSSTINQVQEVLASLTEVLAEDQLLIAGESRLDPSKSISSYRLDDPARPIFLFNRQRLVQNSPPPCEQMLPTNVEPVLPELPLASMMSNRTIGNAWDDAAAGALPSYEAQFRYNFQKGNALLTATRSKLDACNKLLREIHVQEMALDLVLRSSMEIPYRNIDREYREFMSEFSTLSRQHKEVLASFHGDFERLRACKLHPAFRSESRYCLADLLRDIPLKRCWEECKVYHEQLCGKVSVLEEEYSSLKERVEEYLMMSSTVKIDELRKALESYSDYPEQQSVILESLKEDVIKVKKLMEDYSRGKRANAQDVSLGLGAKHDVQINNQLPRMEKYDYKLGNLLKLMVSKKNEMNLTVHNRMQSTAVLQAGIKAVKNQMTGFNEVMDHQRESFETLKLGRRVASSYKASLAEVVRRRAFMKLYFAQANQLAEKMARKRDREMARREEFLRHHGGVLPRDLLQSMGLLDTPSQCLVDISPFDAGVIDLGLSDVERYAPQHLSGVLRLDEEEDGRDATSCELLGTQRLELENSRLRAQLAASIAVISSMDASFQAESLGDPDDRPYSRGSLSVAEKTSEALRLKDDHAMRLNRIIDEKHDQCKAYEERIRELEQRLKEQAEQSSSFESAVTRSLGPRSGFEARSPEEEVKNCIDNGEGLQMPESPGSEEVNQTTRSFVEPSEVSRIAELLRESQVNAADLEKKLHEAREEARIYKCSADRKAAEYNVLRASSVRLRALVERLKICMASEVGNEASFHPAGASLMDSLNALYASVKSDSGDEAGMEIQSVIKLFMALFQQQAELMERSEACKTQLRKEVEDKADMAKSLFARIKVEKQASKEKICLTRFEVHRLAIFFPNAAGHYEALNRGSPNYFLSDESIALFRRRSGGKPSFVVGQIVHIESYVVKEDVNSSSISPEDELRASSNPFGLDLNCEFHVVTLAMVPGLHGF